MLYDIDMTLGNRIKRARERLPGNVTQADLAAIFGTTDKAISNWERDKDIPEFDKLQRLPSVLRVPADWLLNGDGEPPAPDDLRLLLESLPGSVRALALRMIQTLAEDAAAPPPTDKAG